MREQVLALVRASFGAAEARAASVAPGGDAALEAFLHEPAQLVLTAAYDAAAGTVAFAASGSTLLATAAASSATATASSASGNGSGNAAATRVLHFVKLRPQALTDAAALASTVLVSSTLRSPLASLYAALHHVHGPSLLQDAHWAALLDEGTRKLLVELDGRLATCLQRDGGGGGGGGGVGAGTSSGGSSASSASTASIFSLADEARFWEDAAAVAGQSGGGRGGDGGGAARTAEAFARVLQPLAPRFDALAQGGDALALPLALELVTDAEGALDDLWRLPLPAASAYPQHRMRHVLACCGAQLAAFLQRAGARLDLWGGAGGGSAPASSFNECRGWLQDAARLCDAWSSLLARLTRDAWPAAGDAGGARAAWIGEPARDALLEQLGARLVQLLELRTTQEELSALLPLGVQRQCGLAEAAAPLRRLHPLHVGEGARGAWDAAVAAYERALAPADAHAAAELGRELRLAKGQAHQLLRVLQLYRHTLRARRGVSALLMKERDDIVAQLGAQLAALSTELRRRTAAALEVRGAGAGPVAAAGAAAEPPGCVETIAWVQVVRARAALVRAIASDLLGDDEAARSDLAEASEALRDDCELAVQRLHGAWRAACEAALRRGELSLESTGRIMEFDADGNMRVRYSERLVALLRDARALLEQGLAVPKEVRAAAADAEKFYRYAVQLQKVASFYNTLGAEIVPSQKPLLLAPLAAFESAVQDGARGGGGGASSASGGSSKSSVVVTWSEPRQVAAFLEDLQRKADELGTANRRLRALHGAMCDGVAALMEADMLRQRDSLWRERWTQLRELFARFCAPFVAQLGAPSVRGWARHWDMQLYKAVEADYRTGLERLAESIPEMRADIVFSAQARGPAFRPPLEELRATYYREMRRHVAVPATFGGLTGANAHDFEAMARRNAAGLHRVYHNAEKLFANVAKHRDSLRKWCALGAHAPDPEAFVDQHVRSIADFEAALKGLRERREALQGARLEQIVTFECVTLNAAPLRAAAEGHLNALGEALLVALHASLASSLAEVQAFLASANETLSARPNSMAEIARAKREWTSLSQRRGGMEQLGEACEQRRRLLAANAGGLFDLADVTQRIDGLASDWDNFARKMEAFDGIVEEQRAALKGSVAVEIAAVGAELDKFGARWAALKPSEVKGWTAPEVAAVFTALEDWGAQLEALRAKAAALRESCESFGLAPPAFRGLEDVLTDVTETRATWELFRVYDGERQALAGQDWVSFRARLFDLQDFAAKWADAVRGKTKGDAVRARIFDEADGVKRAFGALKYARGEPFKEEHWSALFKKLGMPRGVRLETLLVGHFIDAREACAANLQWLKDLTGRAQGEVTIRDALQELRAWGETADFRLLEHVSNVNGRKTALIKDWKELFTEIGDNQSLLQSLKESAYFKPFADTAAALEQSLATVDECAQALNAIQRRWVYLEPVFGRGALPSEGPRFKRVDEQFRDVMGKVAQDPKVLSLADAALHPGLRETLQAMVDQLERCQKALADFLEEKRAKMSRFYFIGDDDLLEILGQAQNPAVIQSHLKKLYQGVYRVEFSDSPRREPAAARAAGAPQPSKFIVAMCSVAGEVVPLDNAVAVTDDVTQWLTAFTREMSASLASLLVACVRAAHAGEAWEARLPRFPSQVLCLCEQVLFTEAVERVLSAPGGGGAARGGAADAKSSPQALGLADLRTRLTDQLAAYTARKGAAGDTLGALKVKALVLDVIHMLDVVDALASRDVRDAGSWHWQKQLRFYLSENGRCTARMVDASLDYSFEYQGNAPKLVHTPLTDKCFLTITQGLAMGFGGNPYGPAGTGKTESVKALGAAVGRQVLVFNCDEGIDFLSMGRIFTGLVKCGAWGCFDEFNRLREDQLSAVSQQIQVIQVAIKERAPTAQLLGRTVDVNANAGIFVTLNPAGKGYGGRSRLPDNLKALFRPVAMSKPDNELIAEVVLYSEGFMTAKELGRKMVSLFTVASQLLSSQQHYDWGLRAMKACLTTGGSLIAAARQSSGLQRLPAEAERELLIKAVRVNTLSKLTFDDAVRFLGLMSDVFPGTRSEDIRDEALEAAIRSVMAAKPFNLEFDAGQMRKILQLKEALGQRMGCVVVGPSGCGKSTLWRVLQAALIKLGQPVIAHVMNPKSMPRARLLGEMDPDTREWTDGVLTAAARQVVREPLTTRSWVVCDGDVDPEWIESLNSVLDDNHLLTLPNGERIAFNDNVNFLFETHDLRFASPATVSRMGMIFLSDDDVDVQRVAKCWLAAQPEAPPPAAAGAAAGSGAAATMAPAPASALATWVDSLFYRALDWVRAAPRGLVVDTTLVGTVLNGLSHLSGGAVRTRADFCVALVRGLGGNLDSESRALFARDVFAWAGERPPDASAPLDCQTDARGELVPIVAAAAGSSALGSPLTRADVLAGAVVTTVSLQRAAAVVAPWMERMEPFVLVGPEGCGKSLLVHHLAAQRRNTSLATLHCNAQTTAEHVVQKIRQGCSLFSANSGRVFRPREGDRLVLFLKDINLPKPDRYNTCGLIAFLQQLLTFRGFYDEHLEFLGIERVHIVCSMNPATTVGRHPLSTRFTATVRIAALDYPDARELGAIAGSYLTAALTGARVLDERFRGAGAAAGLTRLAGSMVEVYAQARARFSVDEHRHYLFTPRDLTAWVVALLRYPLATERNVVDVLAYEAARVFRDRLVGPEACQRFDALLAGTLKQHWGAAPDLRDVFFTALAGGGGSQDKSAAAPSAASESKQGESKSAAEGGAGGGGDALLAQGLGAPLVRLDGEGVRQLAERGLVLFEREERDLGVLLFSEALEHVAQVDRVLSRAGGSLLLVGRPGSGRRSSATLVAFMHGMHWVSPAPPAPAVAGAARDGAAASLKAFFSELKGALLSAGVAGEDTVLYLEDHQLGGGGDDGVLEAVNSLLSSGEVPGLYSHEEQEQLLAPLRPLMSESGFSFRSPWDFFTHRVRARLHVCLALDPTHPSFALRGERNPALFTRCGILWFGAWREQSLRAVAQHTLGDVLEQASAHVAPAALVAHALALHASVESGAAGAGVGAATPRAFVALLRAFKGLYLQRAGGLQAEAGRLRSGLAKLLEAQGTVDELSRSAGLQRAQLREKQAAADAAMSDITDALAAASDRRREVEQLQREVARADGEARRRKAAIEVELGEIQPVLDEAKTAVGVSRSPRQRAQRTGALRSSAAPQPSHAPASASAFPSPRAVDQQGESRRDPRAQDAARGYRGRAERCAAATRNCGYELELDEEVPEQPQRHPGHSQL